MNPVKCCGYMLSINTLFLIAYRLSIFFSVFKNNCSFVLLFKSLQSNQSDVKPGSLLFRFAKYCSKVCPVAVPASWPMRHVGSPFLLATYISTSRLLIPSLIISSTLIRSLARCALTNVGPANVVLTLPIFLEAFSSFLAISF
ncbi:hypothetical protein D3C73_733000 [compost metagenome]